MLDFTPLLLATGSQSTTATLIIVVVLGVGAQWVGWRLRIPSILLLLPLGFLAGITGFLDPDKLLQHDLLVTLVSMSVALILFEGGLSLRFSELQQSGATVLSLCTIGAVVTGVLITLAAYLLLDVGFGVALIIGTMLVVTGPTVVGPLLRHIRPLGRVSAIAKWEGIVIDPVGAMLAVLALAVIESVELGHSNAFQVVVLGVARTVFWGGVFGVLGAWPALWLLRRYWIPDHLEVPVLLMLVIACFGAANHFQAESGLFAVTLMGILLTNQKDVGLHSIVEFKENLRVLLISFLFIVLSARIGLEALDRLGWGTIAFVVVLLALVRPLAVYLSTIGRGFDWKERVFLSWLAPRGIVAAALASAFALALEDLRDQITASGGQLILLDAQAIDSIVPVVFLVIVATVSIYGLTAGPLALKLGLASPNPQGVLFASADATVRAIAKALHEAGFHVLLVDSNRDHVNTARMEGLPTVYASMLSEHAMEEIDLGGIGRLLAMTPNDEVNSLAALHFSQEFGRAEIYQLMPTTAGKPRVGPAGELMRGRRLFAADATYEALDERFESGAVVKSTSLGKEFDYNSFQTLYGDSALVLFMIGPAGMLTVNTVDQPVSPAPGHTLISLVDPVGGAERGDVGPLEP